MKQLALLLRLFALLAILSLPCTQATHFRYGTITWEVKSDGLTVDFVSIHDNPNRTPLLDVRRSAQASRHVYIAASTRTSIKH
jgi:hypothetical protein